MAMFEQRACYTTSRENSRSCTAHSGCDIIHKRAMMAKDIYIENTSEEQR